MNEPMGPQYFLPIEYDELAKLRARTAGAEREAAQEKARNAELVEQLRVAREATREAVDREGALVTQCNYARDKVERLERWLASAKEQHLADVGTLSRCLEARDKRVAELEFERSMGWCA